LHTAKLIKNIR